MTALCVNYDSHSKKNCAGPHDELHYAVVGGTVGAFLVLCRA